MEKIIIIKNKPSEEDILKIKTLEDQGYMTAMNQAERILDIYDEYKI